MRTGKLYLLPLLVAASLAAGAAKADDCPQGPIEYCYCIYENALDELKDLQGTSSTTMRQRVSAAKKALDKCLSRGTDQVTDDIKKTN